jgi:hypothetical protein
MESLMAGRSIGALTLLPGMQAHAVRQSTRNNAQRYRLLVVASSVEAVLQSAGGWLCDRAFAGWDIDVLVAGGDDARPLQILGVRKLDFDAVFSQEMQAPHCVIALAVEAALVLSDARVRDAVVKALDGGRTEVTLWGDTSRTDLHDRVDQVQHQLSTAAQAFKAHALAAASVPQQPVGATEVFRSGTQWLDYSGRAPANQPTLLACNTTQPKPSR